MTVYIVAMNRHPLKAFSTRRSANNHLMWVMGNDPAGVWSVLPFDESVERWIDIAGNVLTVREMEVIDG